MSLPEKINFTREPILGPDPYDPKFSVNSVYCMIMSLPNYARRGKYFHEMTTILKRHGIQSSINPGEKPIEPLVKDHKVVQNFLDAILSSDALFMRLLFNQEEINHVSD